MNLSNPEIGWPAENIRLLLKACMADDGARGAWDKWLRIRNIDDVNWAELRLLATLASRINTIDPDTREKPRLEGIRRFVWSMNQIRLDRSIQVIDLLQHAGIPVMLLKGMARIATNPSLASARFVRDVDLLVHSSCLETACDILIKNGWRPVNGILPGKSRAEPFGRILPANEKNNPDNENFHVDIHRSVIHYGRSGTFDDAFWDRCKEGVIRERTIKVPSETDQFLHAIVHATISDPTRPVDWVIDAMDAARNVDWQLLAYEIDRRRAGAAVANTLEYLAEDLGLEIPVAIRKLIERDRRNPLYKLEVEVYWRLPENRIRYGGVYRKLAEWTRSRHCLYKAKNRNTLWVGRRLADTRPALEPRSDVKAPVLDFEVGMTDIVKKNCIIDIETSENIRTDILFDLLLDDIWFGRLLIPISGSGKSGRPVIWRFEIPFNDHANNHRPNPELRMLLLDEQSKVPDKVPGGLKIALLVNREKWATVSTTGYKQGYSSGIS